MVAEQGTVVRSRAAAGDRRSKLRRARRRRVTAPTTAAPGPSDEVTPRSRAVGLLVPTVAWALGAAVFFRAQLTSGFDVIMGNDGDARLVVLLHEHWWKVIGGHAAWDDPGFFHPTEHVLGYADTFALNTVVYAPLRAAGLDPFLAFQWMLVAMSAMGFGALYVVLRRYLGVHPALAAGAGLLYCFANNLAVKAGHPQVLTSWWTPVCALLGLVAVHHRDPKVRFAAATAFGALASLIVYTSFYVGWTAVMAAVLITLVLGVTRLRAVLGFCRERWHEVAAALAGTAVGVIPFISTYLPVLAEKGGRTFAETQQYAPQLRDLVNVGPTNWLWGSTLVDLYGARDRRLGDNELMLAVTPVLALGTALLAVVVAVARRRSRRSRLRALEPSRPDGGLRFAWAAIVAAILLAVLPVDFDGWSLWRPIWETVPGASALRAAARMQIVAGQLVAISFAICLSRLLGLASRARGRWRSNVSRVAAAGLLGLVLVEQLNLGSWSQLDRSDQLDMFRAIPSPPVSCTSFYLTSSGLPEPEYVLQIDAMLMANSMGIPTLNGYSGQAPDGWMLGYPQEPAFRDHVRRWAATTGTSTGLCGYDKATRTWDGRPLG